MNYRRRLKDKHRINGRSGCVHTKIAEDVSAPNPTRDELQALEKLRPKTRGECKNGIRPCPFVSCRHHLYLEISPKTGALLSNFANLEVHEMEYTCSLDVSETHEGGLTLEDVGAAMNISRERVRQIEADALRNFIAIDREGLVVDRDTIRLPVLALSGRSRSKKSCTPKSAPRRFTRQDLECILRNVEENPRVKPAQIRAQLQKETGVEWSHWLIVQNVRKLGYEYSRWTSKWEKKRPPTNAIAIRLQASNDQFAQSA